MNAFNVLVSSGGRRVPLLDMFRLAFKELELDGKVMVTDMSPLSPAFQSADLATLVPPCASPEFVPAMLDICRRNGIRLLIPGIDPELPVYAHHRQEFLDIGTSVAISSPEAVRICWDKKSTHEWLVENGFPTVKQAGLEEVHAGNNGWSFPLLVKPVHGSASIGVAVVDDLAGLDAATSRGDFIVQTIAKGHEYTIDALADGDGKCICAIPRRRLEVRAGEISKGVTERSEALIELAHRICERLPGAFGYINIQVFHDSATGESNVIEINPRVSSGLPLSWEAGGKYPRWLIEDVLGLPSSATPEWQDGLVMLRWDQAIFTSAARAGL